MALRVSKSLLTTKIDEIDRDLTPSFVAKNGYARRGRQYTHKMVAERVLGRSLVAGEVVDHINGDPLDNRRSNLRVTDATGNAQNRVNIPLRGVTWHRRAMKFQAIVRHNGKNIYLGLYPTAEEAATVAASKRRALGFLGSN